VLYSVTEAPSQGEIVTEAQFKSGSWGAGKWTPTELIANPAGARGTNPLQDSFIQLERAEQLRIEGKLDRAQKICESLLRAHPDYMAALHTIGLIYADKKNYERSLDYLVRAVMLNPRSLSTLTALSGIYLELNAREMAAQTLELARAIKPRDPNVLVTLGEIYRQEREYELAKEAFRQALDVEADLVPAAKGLGWACFHLGQNEEVTATFEKLLKRGERTPEVLTALANVPASFISADLLSELDRLDTQEWTDETACAFVRAAALDNAGRYQDAWDQLVPANRTMFAKLADNYRDIVQRQRTMLALLQANRLAPATPERQQPISLFILGPSRSGKTTMERLMATLGDAKAGYENPIVENAIRRAFQGAGLLTSGFFEMLPPQLYPHCREIYLEELGHRAGSAKVFTNTHPARINDAPLIASAFPNVRLLFIKRDVDDIVLRIYFRRYGEGNAYAYDLTAAREHVTWYYQMMDVMAAKLPSVVRIVHYEDMIADPAAALRVAADLCGLPMTDKPLPSIGDDRGCAEPYREFMAAASKH
jgi:tetratricopeptide (TPR) repeat protein